jgi:cytoskeleton protein RodZ
MQGYKDIGELLAHAREERRMTVADVAKVLHIRPRYIMALEAGDIAAMPSLPYVKGYLKRYASYISLDIVEILRRFELASEQGHTSSFFMPHSFSHEKRLDSRHAIVLSLLALFFLILWAIWMRPEQAQVSVVEPAPEKLMEPKSATVSLPTDAQAACLQPQTGLYPPCYWQGPEPTQSVMHLIKP